MPDMVSSAAPLRLLTHYLTPGAAGSNVHSIPTSHPGYQDHASAPSTSSAPSFSSHGAAARLYGDIEDKDGESHLIVARAIEESYVLEVNALPWTTGKTLQHRSSSLATPPPLHFLFPAPLLPSLAICIDELSGNVHIFVLTITGWLYRLSFSLQGDSGHVLTLPHQWVIEHRIANIANSPGSAAPAALGGRTPTDVHALEAGMLLVACKDGTLVKLEQDRSNSGSGFFRESLLRSSTFFKKVSKLFSRSTPSSPSPAIASHMSEDSSAPSHIVSMTSHLREDASALAFCVSRDRKLRVWDLVTDVCLRTVDLPSGLNNGHTQDGLPPFGVAGSLRPTIRAFVPNGDDGYDYQLYLVIYIPAPLPSGSFFALYGVELAQADSKALSVRADAPSATASTAGLGALSLLWQQDCDNSTRGLRAELRDCFIATKSTQFLTLWSLWDMTGRVAIKSIEVDLDEGNRDNPFLWSTVEYDRSPTYSPLYGPRFDNVLADEGLDPDGIADTFLSRIMEAGRFSSAALSWALRMYATTDSSFLQGGITAEQIAATVANGIELHSDPQTGALLYAQYHDEIRREWRRFAGLLEDADAEGRWPIALVPSNSESVPIVLMRDRLLVLTEEQLVDTAKRFEESGDEDKPLVTALETFYTGASVPSHRRRSREADPPSTASMSLEIIKISRALREELPERCLLSFVAQIDNLASAPLESDLLEALLDVFDSVISPEAEHLTATFQAKLRASASTGPLETSLWALCNLLMSTTTTIPSSQYLSHPSLNTSLGSSLVADGIYQTMKARLDLALCLTILVIFVHATQDDIAQSFDQIPFLVAELVDTVHCLSTTVQLCDRSGRPEISSSPDDLDEVGNAVVEQMKQLNVGKGSLPVGEIKGSDNLLHALISQDLLAIRADVADSHTRSEHNAYWQASLTSSIALGIVAFGIFPDRFSKTASSLPVETGVLALRLVSHGYPSSALSLVDSFPKTPAAYYIAGRALLSLEDLYDSAADALRQVVPGILELGEHKTAACEDDSSSQLLVRVLSFLSKAAESEDHLLASYYHHVSDLFETVGADSQIAMFTRLALEAMRGTGIPLSASLADLYSRRFRSELALRHYSACYTTLMEMVNVDSLLRRDCLRTLVSAMCEADQVLLLFSFNFAGQQSEVERNLSFKARNSDPRATVGPNYYHILYSYHMQRGDFTSAAAVMYQQAHRLAELYRSANTGVVSLECFTELAVQQARCYLAAMNALSLLASKNAWFANAVIDTAADLELPQESSLLLSHYIPSQHWQPDSKELRIVRLEDVRTEYHLTLARLELVPVYPELANPTMTLKPSDMVALFIRNDQYDKAFATARVLNADESPIFSALALKCAMTAHVERECEKLRKERKRTADPDDTEATNDPATKRLLAGIEEDDSYALIEPFRSSLSEENIAAIGSWTFLQSSPRTMPWTGSVAARAWRYLKLNLDISDSGSKYRLVVLQRLLLLRPGGNDKCPDNIPQWLTTWFEEKRPDLLIAAYVHGGLASEALRAAISWIKKSTKQLDSVTNIAEVGTVSSQQGFIPYLLLDGLIKMVDERGNKASSEARCLVDELKKEITQTRRSVLDGKWRAAKDWAGQKEKRRTAGNATTGTMEWD